MKKRFRVILEFDVDLQQHSNPKDWNWDDVLDHNRVEVIDVVEVKS